MELREESCDTSPTHQHACPPWFFLQRASSRRCVTHEAEQNSIMGKLDEGLEDFFSKKVIKLSFK